MGLIENSLGLEKRYDRLGKSKSGSNFPGGTWMLLYGSGDYPFEFTEFLRGKYNFDKT